MEQLYEKDDRVKVFTLPTSGSVTLFGPEVGVVQTREFQRLAGIKQLGTSYVVFRGAIHTRFEHSLGTLHKAEQMVQAINRNPRSRERVDDDARKLARLGSLLHDLPHVPFGHTLEDEFYLLDRHDENSERIETLLVNSEIGERLRVGIGADLFEQLIKTLKAKTDSEFAKLRYPFVGDIVGNTVCADLLDYVERDLTACGMPVAIGDRFLDYLTLTSDSETRQLDRRRIVLNLDKRSMPRPDVESEVIKLLNYRYELAERVYFHHAKNAASVMIGRAVQEAGFALGASNAGTDDRLFHWLSDEVLLHSLANYKVAEAFGISPRPQYVGDRELAGRLASGVLNRELYKIAYLGVHDDLASRVDTIYEQCKDPEERRAIENRIAGQAGLPPGAVLLHVPRRKMMTKAADVRVRTSTGDILPLSEWDQQHSRRIGALNDAHERLWRVTGFIDPNHLAAQGLVRLAIEEEFKAPSRYVEKRPSMYLREVFDRFADEEGWTVADLPALTASPLVTGGGLEDTRAWMREAIIEWRSLTPPHKDGEGPASN